MERILKGSSLAICFAAAALSLTAQSGKEIRGTVRDGAGPVSGAVVRVQTTAISARTNERGEFSLRNVPDRPSLPVTASAAGYYNAGPVAAKPGDSAVAILLKKHPADDDASYAWLSARASAGQRLNCENCHSAPEQPELLLPFDEWKSDAHGTSGTNRRFLSMYNGTDLGGGKQSPPTRHTVHRDYGLIPLPPDPNLPYFGPGFKLDFPDSAGNCAACHLPASGAPYDTDPNRAGNVGLEGVACDLCHKIWDVRLQPSSGLPYANAPGVLSLEFRRPGKDHQLFLGPYDDVPGEDAYSALQNQSRICAACHFAQFRGVQVYNSYGEWRASPYSDPVTGQTCQDCHMPRRGTSYITRAEKGGQARDPKTVFSHLMTGAADRQLLEDTATIELEAVQQGAAIRVKATVTNRKAGHHMPTDHPARNIILVVSAKDGRDQPLVPLSGPLVPDWGGRGAAPEDYGGQPGRGYAKILEELWTEVAPTAAYWNPTVLREDTRIPALGKDVSEYEFLAPSGGGPLRISARLVFRRAFRGLAVQKGWNDPDILMTQAAVSLQPARPAR